MANTFSVTRVVQVTDSLATTPPVAMGRFVSGRIIGRTYGGMTLTVYESDAVAGTYAKCTDVGTSGVMSAIEEDESVALPEKLAGAKWLKFVGNEVGEIALVLKSE